MSPDHLPFGKKLMVLLVVLSEQTVLFIIPSLIVYMVEDLSLKSGARPSPDQVAYKVAIIEGLNRGFLILGGIIWSSLSDFISRKTCMIITISCFSLTSLGFGLSTSFQSAVFWRISSGLFSGSINTLKSAIPDMTTDKNISELYKYFSAGFGVSSILGPFLAGYFSRPSENFALLRDSKFLIAYPYFLPFLVNAFIDLLGLIFVLIYVPATGSVGTGRALDRSTRIWNQKYLVCVLAFAVHGFAQFSYRALVPLWAKLDHERGGLGWARERDVGLMNTLSGVVVVMLALVLTARLVSKFGLYRSLVLSEIVLSPLMVLPLVSASFDGLLLWVVLVVTNGLNICFSTIFISFVSIAISNSVDLAVIGLGIGFAQTVVAVLRFVSAFASAAVFGKMIESGWELGFKNYLIFGVSSLLLIANSLMIYFFLDPSIEYRREVVCNKVSTEANEDSGKDDKC